MIRWLLCILLLPILGGAAESSPDDPWNSGFFYDRFPLTLETGTRTEILGPLFFDQQVESQKEWGVPPVFSWTEDDEADFSSFDLVYPVLTYDRYGEEWRFQFFQLFNLFGGRSLKDTKKKRTTLFPIYFRQTSTDPKENYFAFVPFYGHLHNRLLRDEIRFVLFPLWGQSRKKDVVTDNYLYPFFHIRRGTQLFGAQFWPFYGSETKSPHLSTNSFDEPVTIPGHQKKFILWPFFHDAVLAPGTPAEAHSQLFFPFYSFVRSTNRDSTTYSWPLGYTKTHHKEKNYKEWGAPWPLIVFARGEGKTANRVWPFFSHAYNTNMQSRFWFWPVYKYNRVQSAPLDRRRTRILFFLYSSWREKNTKTGEAMQRRDLWPLFSFKKERDGRQRLQIFVFLEPFLPANRSIEKNYSPVWSAWRSQSNPKTGHNSHSLLWNFYRKDEALDSKKVSLLLGLFQYQKHPEGKRYRIFYIPFGKRAAPADSNTP